MSTKAAPATIQPLALEETSIVALLANLPDIKTFEELRKYFEEEKVFIRLEAVI